MQNIKYDTKCSSIYNQNDYQSQEKQTLLKPNQLLFHLLTFDKNKKHFEIKWHKTCSYNRVQINLKTFMKPVNTAKEQNPLYVFSL